jgi:branched-chain amino acid transport system substrate-binding protein
MMADTAACDRTLWRAGAGAMLALIAGALFGTPACPQSGEPIKIGYGISLTGSLAANGKSALLAHKIWEQDINAKGGLLGRPVKLIYYDDHSDPKAVPEIYAKQLDQDKVDLIIGGFGNAMLAKVMPIAIQKKKTLIGLFGLAVNSEFHYRDYFAMIPTGPESKSVFTRGFFDVAMEQSPRPQTVAIVAAAAEFSRNVLAGARENANQARLRIVYDQEYPLATPDFVPIVRAVAASNPDLVIICSNPLDSMGMVRAVREVGFRPKMIGGAMVGLQATAIKTQLGPLLNGFVNYDFWLPVPKMMSFPGVFDFLKKYQATAESERVDPLGYYVAPWAYAQLELLGEAVNATKSLNDPALADYLRYKMVKTVIGDVKFGKDGEWAQPRVLQVQFQHVKGNDLAQFKDISTQVVVAPLNYGSGKLIYPYEKAL